MSRAHLPELADARLSRALDVVEKLLRALPDPDRPSSRLSPNDRDAVREARALLAEHGR